MLDAADRLPATLEALRSSRLHPAGAGSASTAVLGSMGHRDAVGVARTLRTSRFLDRGACSPDAGRVTAYSRFPAVPAYAWAWLQRSRPVLVEAADRLTGGPPSAGFLDDLRQRFETDPFTCDVLVDVIAEVAFGGRVPTTRPGGVTWDRGLTWWAAALSGTTPAAFDARSAAAPTTQRALFDTGPATVAPPSGRRGPAVVPADPADADRPSPLAQRERRAVADALRQLLRASDGDQIPASAIRQLVAQLDPR